MQLRIELKEELLLESIQTLHNIYRAIEDDDLDDIEDLGAAFSTAVQMANDVLEWVAQAKASLARQGVAA